MAASRGMVNSAMTRMLSTVRNLLYMGMKSIIRSVSAMKWRPSARRIERAVRITNAHLSGPRTMTQPKMNRATISAPTYTGPFVPSGSPKYWLI